MKLPFEVAPQDLPDLAKAASEFSNLCQVIACLRDPTRGCPWDLEQSHESLARYMIEEAYEATNAIQEKDPAQILDELGDVLLQVVLHSQLALQSKTFSIVDVIANITAKMVRRHPHVFGDLSQQKLSVDDIMSNWQQIKAKEKSATTEKNSSDIFEDNKIQKTLPAMRQSVQIGKLAKKVNFDFDDAKEVFGDFLSEVEEVTEAIDEGNKEHIIDEIGDVFFSLCQLCRHLDLDPETLLIQSNSKFLRRYKTLSVIAKERGIDPVTCDRKEKDALWAAAKKRLSAHLT